MGIDAMHCVFLGVVKQLVALWFNSKHSGQRWYCGSNIAKVDKRLLEIKPPSVISRVPRSIEHHLKFWKGKVHETFYQHFLVGVLFWLFITKMKFKLKMSMKPEIHLHCP